MSRARSKKFVEEFEEEPRSRFLRVVPFEPLFLTANDPLLGHVAVYDHDAAVAASAVPRKNASVGKTLAPRLENFGHWLRVLKASLKARADPAKGVARGAIERPVSTVRASRSLGDAHQNPRPTLSATTKARLPATVQQKELCAIPGFFAHGREEFAFLVRRYNSWERGLFCITSSAGEPKRFTSASRGGPLSAHCDR
ncbi:hypothetical protein KM043_002038 [Ampulex compressa]|nr:hypothetical protein KM043_002038 [Ampulex compressa]